MFRGMPSPGMTPALSLLLLSLLLLGLTGCIVTYSAFPKVNLESTRLPQKPFPLYYHIGSPTTYLQGETWFFGLGPGSRFPYPSPPTHDTSGKLEQVLVKNSIFAETIPAATPPERGLYCSVDVIPKFVTFNAFYFWILSVGTYGVLPSYSASTGYIVKYDLYMNKEFKHTYQYEITRKGTIWLGLLPFMWVNWLTPNEEDAFRSTVFQFFFDAERDGLLTQMSLQK